MQCFGHSHSASLTDTPFLFFHTGDVSYIFLQRSHIYSVLYWVDANSDRKDGLGNAVQLGNFRHGIPPRRRQRLCWMGESSTP